MVHGKEAWPETKKEKNTTTCLPNCRLNYKNVSGKIYCRANRKERHKIGCNRKFINGDKQIN